MISRTSHRPCSCSCSESESVRLDFVTPVLVIGLAFNTLISGLCMLADQICLLANTHCFSATSENGISASTCMSNIVTYNTIIDILVCLVYSHTTLSPACYYVRYSYL